MQRLFPLLLVFICAASSAQVYKRVGPDGKVYFSDQPGPDAKQIEVAPPQTVSMPPAPVQTGADTQEPAAEEAAAYTSFTIVSPTSEEGVRANDGNVPVQLSLQPQLQAGHSIILTVDGEDGETMKTGGNRLVSLSNLSRGRHTVEARVVDATGKALIQTGPVSFFVLRVAGGG
jgi:hypothetical protein